MPLAGINGPAGPLPKVELIPRRYVAALLPSKVELFPHRYVAAHLYGPDLSKVELIPRRYVAEPLIPGRGIKFDRRGPNARGEFFIIR